MQVEPVITDTYELEWNAPDQYLIVRFKGVHDKDPLRHFLSSLQEYFEVLGLQGESQDMLVDMVQLEKLTRDGRKQHSQVIQKLELRRVGVWGLNPLLRAAATFIVYASKRRDEIRLCKSREEAIEWLLASRAAVAS